MLGNASIWGISAIKPRRFEMRTVIRVFLGAVLLLVDHTGEARADTVFSYDPATAHWYAPVLAPAGITWGDAKAAAESRGGYLACIQDSAENNFVFSLVDTPAYWTGPSYQGDILGPWLGGYSNAPGTWKWVTGEPFNYVSWYPTQPDAFGGPIQASLYYASDNIGSTWGDDQPTGTTGYPLPQAYVIEFDHNPTPEPSTLALLGISAIGLVSCAWRRRKRA
jgi:hypothetical protein